VKLKGWARTSLIDYPDHISTVLFTGGCNFRCPMCHNSDLVLGPDRIPDLAAGAVWEFLDRRAGLVDGVVITGGEPTLQPDLVSFLGRLRNFDVDVKLDTNGYCPHVLEQVLAGGLVDYVALDVKAPPARYAVLTGRPQVDVSRVARSIDLLRDSEVRAEFRTTVVPGMLDESDVSEIARWVRGAGLYVLQQFRPLNTLDPELALRSPYPAARLKAMAAEAQQWVTWVVVRT
jgi:pyruvate formate lyase activating enzyme